MKKLSQDLIITTKSYGIHPFAGIIRNYITIIFENDKMVKQITTHKRIPNTKYHTVSIVVVRDDTTS